MTEVIVVRVEAPDRDEETPYVEAGWQGKSPAIPPDSALRPDRAGSARARQQAEKYCEKRKPHFHGTILPLEFPG